ncbi:MAG: peptide chain release factor N(5)-glutamine methyltransferase [Chlamydiota bacterium]
MKSIKEILDLSVDFLEQKGVANPRRQAEELLGAVLGCHRVDLYINFDRPLNEDELKRSREVLARRGQREPLQYILGEVDFYGCNIAVSSAVLIPRQETEILVDNIVRQLSRQESLEGKVLWDVCCGSGCIGIALKKALPQLEVMLSDNDPQALKIAQTNAESNQVEVEILPGDFLEPFHGRKADFVVCNPPYISDEEYANLDPEVREYEPKVSLVSGRTGLEFYHRLAEGLPELLNAGALVWLEIGFDQGAQLQKLFSQPPWRECSLLQDWAGHDRFIALK